MTQSVYLWNGNNNSHNLELSLGLAITVWQVPGRVPVSKKQMAIIVTAVEIVIVGVMLLLNY